MTTSVIMPTRGNYTGLKKCLAQFALCTAHPEKLEILLVMDKCDPHLERTFALVNEFALSISLFVRERSDWFSRDYYNWAAQKAKGEQLWMFNDDCYVVTPDWDTKIARVVGTRKVYLVDTLDSTHDDIKSFPRFPLISRAAYEALGYALHPQIRMWGADAIAYQVYAEANCVINVHEVKLQHDHRPSKRFYDMYDEDRRAGVFPVPALDCVEKLKKAKEQYDGAGADVSQTVS